MAVLIRWGLAAALALCTTPGLAVFGGKDVAPSSPVARTLVAILYKGETGLGLCTGALLSPTLVLTAAHCTAGEAADIRIVFATTLEDVPADRVRGAANVARPEPTPEHARVQSFRNPADIALIALDAPAPDDAGFARITDTPSEGPLLFAGFGATSDLASPGPDGKRQVGFDRTLRQVSLDTTAGTDVRVADQSTGRGVCTGDSGGPLFEARGDTLIVSGVLIGVSNKRNAADFCRGKAWFASVPYWTGWIVDAAARLGTSLR